MTPLQRENEFLKFAHSISLEKLISELQIDTGKGLTESEVKKRLKIYGSNSYKEQKQKSIFLIFLQQFNSPIVILLVVAAGVSFSFKHWLEAFSIIGVIFITAAIGFFMELQARRSMNALKKMDVIISRVWRDNAINEVPSENIVPGDIIILEAGDVVPADGRLVDLNQMEADESSLTGESMPVLKEINELKKNTDLADRTNMVFKGTHIIKGNCRFLVTGTGTNTELGQISSMVEKAGHTATPLEKKLSEMTKKLIWVTTAFAVIFIITGLIQGKEIYLIVETAIALAVAAIPEGLPIVSTLALTYGMLRMAKKNVIIKKLASVETLGGTNIIFTDKTGTLTENKINVNTLAFSDSTVEIGEENQKFILNDDENENSFCIEKLFQVAVLCNNSTLKISGKQKKHLGDPIETAMLIFAEENKINSSAIIKEYPRVAEQPFDSVTKLMGTLHKNHDGYLATAKGAAEVLIDKCTTFCKGEKTEKLDTHTRKEFLKIAEQLQSKGLRVLAYAYKVTKNEDKKNFITELTLIGFVGFLDPPRSDVAAALKECRDAGIRVIMITGDHPSTSFTIAEKIKLAETNVIINGSEMDKKGERIHEKIMNATVFARVTPSQKLEMVSLYQKKGNIVAMTGDGINDAPALKKSDIGIAMGQRGTQVAKETADIILKKDSFKTIVTAIEQGRIIFQNIRRFMVYLLSCNLSEILIVFFYGLFNFSFSILPLQILFLNMVTDIFPALALGMGTGNKLSMKNPPRNPKEPILVKRDWYTIIIYAFIMAIPIMAVAWYCNSVLKFETEVCNNITFFSLAFAQLWHVFNLSSQKISFFKNEITQNKFIWMALALCTLIILVFYWLNPLKEILGLGQLTPQIWIIIGITSIAPVLIIQLFKRVFKILD
ncbi:MAG: cation-translocating P-type ATPase [Bacteroidia bacterium]